MELPEIKNHFRGGKLVGEGIDSAAYHRQDAKRGDRSFALSRSELMLFYSNPARWIDGYEPKDTDSTAWGSLLDCLLLTPQFFDKRFALRPTEQKATKNMSIVKDGEAHVGDLVQWSPQSSFAKEWKKQAESDGKIIVTPEERSEAQEAIAKLKQDQQIGALLACSKVQIMCISEYFDRETEITVPVKCLIDLVPALETPFQNELADFKTARNGDPIKWQSVVEDRNYDAQAAMNLDIYEAATGEKRTGFRHVIQESEFPFAVGRRYLESPTITIGRMKVSSALALYCQCLKTGTWPGWDDLPVDGLQNYAGWTGIRPKEWTLARYFGQGVRSV